MATTIKIEISGEAVDSCAISKWKVMSGKLDWSKVADVDSFDVIVEYGNGKRHLLVGMHPGSSRYATINGQKERRILQREIIPIVRLFVSCCVRRNKLAAPPSMIIEPKV